MAPCRRHTAEGQTLSTAVPSSASDASPAPSVSADRRDAWIALGFGAWITLGLVLVLWSLNQGATDQPFASQYTIPAYLGLFALSLYCAIRLVASLRRGDGWRGTLPPAYGTLAVGAIAAVAALVLELG